MNRHNLLGHLQQLHAVIVEERQAAKSLCVEKMLELTERKENLLKQIQPLVETTGGLSAEEAELAEKVHSENLRNAYFFWSALNWVRDSVSFIGDKIFPEAYEGSGSMVKSRHSGALLSGRV
ncbi:MAG: hypothetical protein ACQERN_12780 [Thermodesulfobacteriota bacterium]